MGAHNVRLAKAEPDTSQPVDVWRLDVRISVRADCVGALVVTKEKQDVGSGPLQMGACRKPIVERTASRSQREGDGSSYLLLDLGKRRWLDAIPTQSEHCIAYRLFKVRLFSFTSETSPFADLRTPFAAPPAYSSRWGRTRQRVRGAAAPKRVETECPRHPPER